MYNLAKTIIESLQGMNNSGSSKRAAAAWFAILAGVLALCYAFAYVYVVIVNTGSALHKSVEELMWPMIGTIISAALTSLGFTTWEKRSSNKKEVELKKAEVASDKTE